MADPALRIMLIVNEFPPQKVAGTAMATRALARALTARGHRVLVVVTTDPPPGGAPEEGYRLCWMGERPWRGVGTSWRIWHAWRAARAFAPHLIQGQAVSCGLVAALVGRMVGVPSITYAQGYDVFEAGRLQARSEIRLGCALADRLLAVTRQLADAIEEKCGVAGAEVVPHGFELPQPLPDREAARRRLGLDDTERLVLAVGRLERFKGHDLLLDGWPEVVRRHPRALLQIAGGGGRLQALR
ncbi:MAG: glycosyltransferase, partial [Zetaproteobacteria bacterium]